MKKKPNYQSICEDIAQTFVDIYYPEEPWEWVCDDVGGVMHIYHWDIAYYGLDNMLEALKFLPEKDILLAYDEYCAELFHKEHLDYPEGGEAAFPKLEAYMKDPKAFPLTNSLT